MKLELKRCFSKKNIIFQYILDLFQAENIEITLRISNKSEFHNKKKIPQNSVCLMYDNRQHFLCVRYTFLRSMVCIDEMCLQRQIEITCDFIF